MIIEACWRKGADAKTGRQEAEEKQHIAERLWLRDLSTFCNCFAMIMMTMTEHKRTVHVETNRCFEMQERNYPENTAQNDRMTDSLSERG